MEITNPIVAAIWERARRKGFRSLTEFSRAAQISGTTLTKKAAAPGAPNWNTLQKAARALNCDPSDFVAGVTAAPVFTGEVRRVTMRPRPAHPSRGWTKDLPVMGTAHGAAAGGFVISANVIEYVMRPPSLDGVEDAYAIFVIGESMRDLHPPGQLCFVHPHRICRPGDSVILHIRPHDRAETECYIKRLVRATETEIVAEQMHPRATIRYKRSSVAAMHRVLTTNDLFGV